MSALPAVPALVVGKVHHVRHRPLHHAFTHRHYQWLVDLDEPPRLPWWLRPVASFRAEDHLAGAPGLEALRANVLRVAEREGVDTASVTRVLMLAHARVLGHTFDPMTAYRCLDARGSVVAVVVEVHNTYGGRHAYVVRPDDRGRAAVEKAFHVSPFNRVEGHYDLGLHLSPDRVAVAIRLAVGDEPLLTATVTGRVRPATPRVVALTALRHLGMTQRVSGLIRWHGIRLWLRRLPVQPRTSTDPTPEVVR